MLDTLLRNATILAGILLTRMDWQLIETAPKDGTMFLFDAPDLECGVSIGYYKKELRSGFDGKKIPSHITKPKYWMLIPVPPVEQTGG